MTLLLFLHADALPSWWQLDESGRIIARGTETPPSVTPVLAIPPAASVSLHRITLPALAPAQAQAAARLMAAELAAAPIDTLHTAIGNPGPDGQRWLAIASAEAMAGWLAEIGRMGLSPAAMLPAPLLLPSPAQGVAGWLQEPFLIVQAATPPRGFAAEPELAAILGGMEPVLLADADVAAHAMMPPALDLLQNAFARRQPWRAAPGQFRRLALLAAGVGALFVAGDVALLWQAGRAADIAAAQRDSLAATLLPPGTPITNARAQVSARAAAVSAGGFSRLAAPLLEALETRPGVSIASLEADATSLSATLETASPGDISAIILRLETGGLVASAGLPRGAAGSLQIPLRVSRE